MESLFLNAVDSINSENSFYLDVALYDLAHQFGAASINAWLPLGRYEGASRGYLIQHAWIHSRDTWDAYETIALLLLRGANPQWLVREPRYRRSLEREIHFNRVIGNPQLALRKQYKLALLFADDLKDAVLDGDSGLTPLMCAAEHGCVYGVERLLGAGADVHAVDTAGRRAVDYAGVELKPRLLLAERQ